MKQKTKKIIWKIFKIIWFTFGGFILLITLLLLIRMNTIKGWGSIGAALLLAVGVYAIGIFLLITILFLLIRWIIKKIKRKN